MTSTQRIEWDWQIDGSSADADLGNGFSARLSTSPDDFGVDVDDSCFTAEEIDDMRASDLHVQVFHQDREVFEDHLGGIITLESQSYQDARDYIEECAADMLYGMPRAHEMASLMIGFSR